MSPIVKLWTLILVLITSSLLGCKGQTNNSSSTTAKSSYSGNPPVGGEFENREFMSIGMPQFINAVDTSPGWSQAGQKLLITGTIYKPDGRTPAPDVILYYYHTNTEGRYLHRPEVSRSLPPNKLGQTHGYIRGWVKSDSNGHYSIYTVRPGTYPTRDEPAHIHPTIKEPGVATNYYIDEFVFDDDKLLTSAKRKALQHRGGSGILRVLQKGDLQVGERDIILGLNIPGYPQTSETGIKSGLQIGEDQPSFGPYHAYGPDKGSRACPVCKYGRYHGIIYFVGNKPEWKDIEKWLTFLDQQSQARGKYLKTYFVYGDEAGYDKSTRQKELETLGVRLNLKNIALTFVPSFKDKESEVSLSRIDPDVRNTFIIYRNGTIIGKHANLSATAENFSMLEKMLNTTRGGYFDLNRASSD